MLSVPLVRTCLIGSVRSMPSGVSMFSSAQHVELVDFHPRTGGDRHAMRPGGGGSSAS